MAGPATGSDTHPSSQHLSPTAINIIQSSLAAKSRYAYLSAWQKLVKYWSDRSLNPNLPICPTDLVNYLATLFEQGYAASTIASHSAAIAFTHRLLGFQNPSDSFIVKKFLKGATKLIGTTDKRLPITRQFFLNC